MESSESLIANLLGTGIFLAFIIAIIVLMIVAQWKIFSKAGYNGALSLLFFVPFVGPIVFLWFAFSDWPILKRLRGETPGASPVVPSQPPIQGPTV